MTTERERRPGMTVKQSTIIDIHKGVTWLSILAMIAAYDGWKNVVAWVYFGLHGSYGLLWAAKGRLFPDAQWQRRIGPGEIALSIVGLTVYWVAPWLIASGHAGHIEPWFIGCCVMLYGLGVFLHFVSDMQKHMALRLRPGALITEGLWGVVRNPNYLGELCIYLSFALMAMHWAPFVILGSIVVFFWIPNMRRKDKSLSRYPDFAAYRERTKLLIPGLV